MTSEPDPVAPIHAAVVSEAGPRRGTRSGPGADLRAPALAAVVWLAALAGFVLPRVAVGGAVVAATAVLMVQWRTGQRRTTAVAWTLTAGAVVLSAWLHVDVIARSTVHALAADRTSVTGELVVDSDPTVATSPFGSTIWFRASVREVAGRGSRLRVRTPVLVFAPVSWRTVRLGSHLRFTGRLAPADGRDVAGALSVRGPPEVIRRPGAVGRAADRVRAGIRAAVAGQSAGPRALVPGLVDGDDAGLPASTVADFRTSGLTHLVAVSGTNLTLVVGFLLLVARWCGVRARGLLVVGLLGIAGFVVLARAEPSVVRAAAMGTIGLLGLGTGGRAAGSRALGVGTVVLLLVDPWLAQSAGFALSATATAGILYLAPGWRDALARWLPRWLGEAVAVPLAAQLVCTPVIAAISGQVSLVAVLANLLVAVVVGPATVLGLLGGVIAMVWPAGGRVVAAPAAWCARWIIAVAEHSAHLPDAAVRWPSGGIGLVALTALCLLGCAFAGPVLARRGPAIGVSMLLLVAVLAPGLHRI